MHTCGETDCIPRIAAWLEFAWGDNTVALCLPPAAFACVVTNLTIVAPWGMVPLVWNTQKFA